MKPSPRNFKFCGCTLLVLAFAGVFLWHYWLAPLRRVGNTDWWSDHTPRGRWGEIQKKVQRFGLDHDSSIAIGYYGDEKWMEWVVKTLKTNQPSGNCGEGQMHLPEAPFRIANQEPPNREDWVTWWATNKHKSQVEWVRDGFRQQGLELQDPLTTSNTVALLKLVAKSKKWYLGHNAARWLRDSYFEPDQFDLSSVASEDSAQVTKGLIQYSLWLGEHKDGPGQLPLSSFPENRSPSYEWLVNTILVALLAGGVWFLRQASKRSSAA